MDPDSPLKVAAKAAGYASLLHPLFNGHSEPNERAQIFVIIIILMFGSPCSRLYKLLVGSLPQLSDVPQVAQLILT